MKEEMLIYISRQLEIAIDMLERQQKEPTNRMGRPTKEDIVLRYRRSHPTASKRSCAKVTGLSEKTVRKHWDLYESISMQMDS